MADEDGKSWIEEARELRERILARRGGVPLPSSVDLIRACREGICSECGREVDELATRPQRPLRGSGVVTKEYVEKCRALQERIRVERKGKLMPDSTPIIRTMREGRVR